MKTIMIDGMNLALEKGTGVSTYARNLSYEIHEMGHRTEVLYGNALPRKADALTSEISHFDPPGEPEDFLSDVFRKLDLLRDTILPAHAQTIPHTGKVISRAFQSRMPYADHVWNVRNLFGRAATRFAATGRLDTVRLPETPDIMHWTYPIPARVKGAANVYTLHDLVPLRLPFTTLEKKPLYFKMVKKLVDTADHIVTVSENSRRDIIELLDCPEDKVTNTYQSVALPQKLIDVPDGEIERTIEGTFDLPYKGYFLFFGSIEPKKNIGRLIEGYLGSNVTDRLVIIGARAWKSSADLRLIDEKTTRPRIHRFDYAPFALLVNMIRGAKAVVFPSLYEGFGLPILEAMLLGTPVITSTEGSTPEVAGDAALMVDPYDPRAIANAIIEISGNAELRNRLSARGREQAQKFSREAHRERLGAVYDHILAKRA